MVLKEIITFDPLISLPAVYDEEPVMVQPDLTPDDFTTEFFYNELALMYSKAKRGEILMSEKFFKYIHQQMYRRNRWLDAQRLKPKEEDFSNLQEYKEALWQWEKNRWSTMSFHSVPTFE